MWNVFLGDLRSQSWPGRCAVVGILVVGIPGAIVGLVVGLNVHVATAWAAMYEIGIPAMVVGAVLGFLIGCVIAIANRLRAHREVRGSNGSRHL